MIQDPTKEMNVGAMMEATFAFMRPYSKTGLRLRTQHDRTHGSKGIRLSKAACVWLSRTTTGVKNVR